MCSNTGGPEQLTHTWRTSVWNGVPSTHGSPIVGISMDVGNDALVSWDSLAPISMLSSQCQWVTKNKSNLPPCRSTETFVTFNPPCLLCHYLPDAKNMRELLTTWGLSRLMLLLKFQPKRMLRMKLKICTMKTWISQSRWEGLMSLTRAPKPLSKRHWKVPQQL